jgi:radical SAM protein with 4Fe4S-binding SPASM domain
MNTTTEYKPVTAVWEITMGCNMRCRHCGSLCREPLPDELTTGEALGLCDQIGELGLKWITLSGGEPLTRKDWHLLAKRLRSAGVVPNIITNGWLINDSILDLAVDSGVGTFAISLDGDRDTHDSIRKKGSFDRVMKALELMGDRSITAGVITTVHRANIGQLDAIRDILLSYGVDLWQLQIGLPMGSFSKHEKEVLEPAQVDDVINFIYGSIDDDRIRIYPADCVGYYNIKEVAARTRAHRADYPVTWQGCNAGKRSFGILHNGDILGCTSIRDRQFVEGNIRTTALADIWESADAFSWNREAVKDGLSGFCRICRYGDVCLAGCPNTRLTMHGDINSENRYCSYNVALSRTWEKVNSITDNEELASMGKKFAEENELQLAQMVLEKTLGCAPDDVELLNYFGYVSFMLHNYTDALEANERVLALDAGNVYANKGLGLTLVRMGELERGIGFLRRSTELTTGEYMEPYYDLAMVLVENGRYQEADDVIRSAEAKSPGFRQIYMAGIMTRT